MYPKTDPKARSKMIFTAALMLAVFTSAQAVVSRTGTTISNSKISVTQSDTAGGAVVSLTFMGSEFIDVHDLGRLMQCSSYARSGWSTFTTDGYTFNPANRIVINPNQAGDALGNKSFTFFANKVSSTKLQSKCTPREWFTHSWPGLDDNDGAQFDTCRFINTITILSGYSSQVVQNDYKFSPPVSGDWRTEVPALYLLATYNKFYGVDVQNNQMTSLTTSGIAATPFTPGSGIGGIIATTSSNGKSIGIYGALESHGGDVGSRFVCYNFGSSVACKLGAETSFRPIAYGQNQTYTTYIVTGDNPTQVKDLMRNLYSAGLR